jgi:UDP-glucose 4-epimerase
MNVVVTGGCGFIGSHLVDYHYNSGNSVVVIDNNSTGNNVNTEVTYINVDLSDVDSISNIERYFKSADIVYHMASSVGVKYIDKDPAGTLRNSININNNLFPVFEKYNNRVIFASTSEVYGNTNEAKETDVLKIGPPDTLRWGYACAKLMSEFILKTYNFPHTIVRFFNVTGRGQLSKYGMVLPTYVELAKRDEDIIVYGDGTQYRTFCDIRDAVNMLDIVCGDTHVGEIYNIGNTENTLTIAQLAKTVIRVLNSNSKIVYRPYEDDFSEQFGEIYKRKPNTDKMNQYYTSVYSIENIITSMC